MAVNLNVLKLIPPNAKIFDNLSIADSQETELSGPFSKSEKSELIFEKAKNPDDFKQTDIYTYFAFSEDFKSAMESAKSDSQENGTGEKADEEDVFQESSIHLELQREMKEMLKEQDILFGFTKLSAKEEDAEKTTKVKRKKLDDEDDEEYYDTMSGYWRILAAYDEFHISPPDFNAYENEKPHWSETKPIPFEVIEESCKKCEDWLKENFDK